MRNAILNRLEESGHSVTEKKMKDEAAYMPNRNGQENMLHCKRENSRHKGRVCTPRIACWVLNAIFLCPCTCPARMERHKHIHKSPTTTLTNLETSMLSFSTVLQALNITGSYNMAGTGEYTYRMLERMSSTKTTNILPSSVHGTSYAVIC